MSGRLDGATAVITGGANGLGLAMVDRFLLEGADVVVGDIDTDGLERLRRRADPHLTARHCDVTDEVSVEGLVAAAVEEFGGLDVAVANAGRGAFAPIVDHPLEEWQAILDLCLTGVMLTIKHAGRAISDGGSIIAISSMNATQPSKGMAAYCAAKAGVVQLVRCAAMELGERGIRVNAIAPGLVETDATSAMWMLPGVVEEFVDNTTLGRHGTPDDVAGVALFLASRESSFVSGSFYEVDGGGNTGRYPDLPAAMQRLADG